MPYPSSIPNLYSTLSAPPCLSAVGNVYVSGTDASGAGHCWKSLDNGLTWAEMDFAHAPLVDAASLGMWAAMKVGNELVAASVSPVTKLMQISRFSFLTDTWGVTSVSVNVLAGAGWAIEYRSLDNTIIVAGGSQVTFNASYFTFNLGTSVFSAWLAIGGVHAGSDQWTVFSVLRGKNRTIFLLRYANIGPVFAVYQQCLTDAGVLGALSLVTQNNIGGIVYFSGFSDGAALCFAWIPGGFSQVDFYSAPVIDNDMLVFKLSSLATVDPDLIQYLAVTILSTFPVVMIERDVITAANDSLQFVANFGTGFSAWQVLGDGNPRGSGSVLSLSPVSALGFAAWSSFSSAPP